MTAWFLGGSGVGMFVGAFGGVVAEEDKGFASCCSSVWVSSGGALVSLKNPVCDVGWTIPVTREGAGTYRVQRSPLPQ